MICMKTLGRTFLAWLPLGVAVTLVSGLVYATVQQEYRQSLNDPQIQMAEDAAAKLAAGASPSEVVPNPDSVDIVNSLSPWLAVYNADGVSIVSSGDFNGEIPVLPQGVFQAASSNMGKDTTQLQENRITWQSKTGVRQALVVVHYDSQTGGGFAVAGRNMREVESREDALSRMMLIGWLAAMLATLATQWFAIALPWQRG